MQSQLKKLLVGVLVGVALATIPLPARVMFDTIAHDASAEGQVGSGSSSLTFSHTTAGTNRLLFVCVVTGNNSPTVTYNSVSMTQIGTGVSNTGYYTHIFYLAAPATGTNDVVITLGSGTNGILGLSASYTGAAQTGIPDSSNTGTLTDSTPLSVSTTTSADNSWVVGCFGGSPNVDPSAGTATTLRQAISNALPIQGAVVDTNGAVTPAGARALEVQPGATSFQSMYVASFAPAAGGGGGGSGFVPAIRNNPIGIGCCGHKGQF